MTRVLRSNIWETIKSLNPYFIGLSILISHIYHTHLGNKAVSILILLDYLFLSLFFRGRQNGVLRSQSLFYWIIYSYEVSNMAKRFKLKSQSLFYWIIYSYNMLNVVRQNLSNGSQSLFYWIIYSYIFNFVNGVSDVIVSILILLDYLFLYLLIKVSSILLTLSQSLFYWIIYSYPFCRESPLFIIATEFFSDIKIDFFLIFLVFFF